MDRALEHLTQVIENAWLFEKTSGYEDPRDLPYLPTGLKDPGMGSRLPPESNPHRSQYI